MSAPEGELNRAQADHHKHMEFVQSVVTRLANNSFLMKGWALTLSSAILGFSVTQERPLLALAAVAPTVAFWLLDAYYLRQERAFRQMYADVAAKLVADFVIDSKGYARRHGLCSSAFSPSLLVFYGAIVVVALLTAVIAGQAVVGARNVIGDVHVTIEPTPTEFPVGPQPTTQEPVRIPSGS